MLICRDLHRPGLEGRAYRIRYIDDGRLKAWGTHDELGRGDKTLESLFVDLVGGEQKGNLSWL